MRSLFKSRGGSKVQNLFTGAQPKAGTGLKMVMTRMDTSKSGWTPYVYYTTLYSTPRYANLKSGEIRVKDNCARKRVGYRV